MAADTMPAGKFPMFLISSWIAVHPGMNNQAMAGNVSLSLIKSWFEILEYRETDLPRDENMLSAQVERSSRTIGQYCIIFVTN
jgi:hypothetical protein